MKSLLIMRHAKAAARAAGGDDFQRPLNRRGREDATLMGDVLEDQGVLPEAVVCSAAARAVETARKVAAACGFPATEVGLDERLYLAGPGMLEQVAAAAEDTVSTLLLVAHNPGMEEWTSQLCGTPVHFPTAALALVEMPVMHWRDIVGGHGRLRWLIIPRQVRGSIC